MLTVFSQMPNYCTVCGLSKAKDPSISLYRIPKRAGTPKDMAGESQFD